MGARISRSATRLILVAASLALLPAAAPARAPAPLAIHVAGNQLVDASGKRIRLLGVNRSGFEYACFQWGASTEGPTGRKAIAAMRAWRINAVRIPLNAKCWLQRPTYRRAVKNYVARLHRARLYVILDLHLLRRRPPRMPDAIIAPRFWRSVARTFARDRAVMFDLYNEPWKVAWPTWQRGMQRLLDAVRSTGSRAPVLVGGLQFANDLSGWLQYRPTDPAGQVAASFHLYNFNACIDEACWERTVAPVALAVPVVTGELGEDTCGHAFIDRYMAWADARGISYLGWTWNVWNCRKGPALITSWRGTPTRFGAGFRRHLLTLSRR